MQICLLQVRTLNNVTERSDGNPLHNGSPDLYRFMFSTHPLIVNEDVYRRICEGKHHIKKEFISDCPILVIPKQNADHSEFQSGVSTQELLLSARYYKTGRVWVLADGVDFRRLEENPLLELTLHEQVLGTNSVRGCKHHKFDEHRNKTLVDEHFQYIDTVDGEVPLWCRVYKVPAIYRGENLVWGRRNAVQCDGSIKELLEKQMGV